MVMGNGCLSKTAETKVVADNDQSFKIIVEPKQPVARVPSFEVRHSKLKQVFMLHDC